MSATKSNAGQVRSGRGFVELAKLSGGAVPEPVPSALSLMMRIIWQTRDENRVRHANRARRGTAGGPTTHDSLNSWCLNTAPEWRSSGAGTLPLTFDSNDQVFPPETKSRRWGRLHLRPANNPELEILEIAFQWDFRPAIDDG
jgi:hypothetical protein